MEPEREILEWVGGCSSLEGEEKNLINVLLALQARFGYLPKTGMKEVARQMGLSPANVYGVATFYNQFRFVPPGKHPIRICTGTACHIRQATKVMEHWERRLGIPVGEVTKDGEYSLDRVACVGCCTMAPVVVVGEEVIGGMSATKVDGILLQHRIQREQASSGSSEPRGEGD